MIVALITGTGFSEETHHKAKRLRDAGDILPLEKILERAKRRYPGRVLETELEEIKGRLIYEIELLDKDGVVREMKFDARTGELLKTKEEKKKGGGCFSVGGVGGRAPNQKKKKNTGGAGVASV